MNLHVNYDSILGPDQNPSKGGDQEVIEKVKREVEDICHMVESRVRLMIVKMP